MRNLPDTIRRCFLCAGLVILFANVGCSRAPAPTLLTWLKNDSKPIVEHPETVHAYRIVEAKYVNGYMKYFIPPIKLSGPVSLTSDQIQDLETALHAHGATNNMSGCNPNPGVEFDFLRGSDTVTLTLCFGCRDASFLTPSGKYLGGGQFPHVRPQLISLAKLVFPRDAKIQALDADLGARNLEKIKNADGSDPDDPTGR